MDMLHTNITLPEDHNLFSGSFPLSVTCGNIQSLAVDSREGIENQSPFSKQEPHFPIPIVKLGSNDILDNDVNHDIRLHKIKPFRPRVPFDPKRPFLQHPKYVDYMRRQRQELGDDGKPIWSDEVETAFQDGMIMSPSPSIHSLTVGSIDAYPPYGT